MAHEVDVMAGIAQLIAADGAASWNRAGVYDPDQTGIYLRAFPEGEEYSNLVSLATYPLSEGVDQLLGLQVRTRKDDPDPQATDDLDEAIFWLLHGMYFRTLSTGVLVTQCLRRSAASLGQDQLQRWVRSSNYELNLSHPSASPTF